MPVPPRGHLYEYIICGHKFVCPVAQTPRDPASPSCNCRTWLRLAQVFTNQTCSSASLFANPARHFASAKYTCASHKTKKSAAVQIFGVLCAHLDSNQGPSP